MSEFDPYFKWLGIPPEDQPPDHYRLLGIPAFTSDADVIANSIDRQVAHVRTFTLGPHSDDSQRILNELAAARVCLESPEKKAAYDVSLRARVSEPQHVVGASEAIPTEPEDVRREVVTAARHRKWLLRVGVGGGAAVLLLIVIGVAWTAWQEADSQRKAADRRQQQVATRKASEQKAAEQKAAEQKAAAKKAVEGREPLTLHHPATGGASVRSVSFSPDGKRIVSGADDTTVKIWDAQTGQETLSLLATSK